MRQIVPTQQIDSTARFPLQGKRCKECAMILAMELFGSPISQVADETGLSNEEIDALCNSPDYAFIKDAIINNIRKLDIHTFTGKVIQEADNAFKRMTELAENADREDVRFNANKDLMDRAMLANVASNNADELRITLIKRR